MQLGKKDLQALHCHLPVLKLGATLGSLGNNTCRYVAYAYRRIGGIAVLAARPGPTVKLY